MGFVAFYRFRFAALQAVLRNLWILPRAKKHAPGMFFTHPSGGSLSSNPYPPHKKNTLRKAEGFFMAKVLQVDTMHSTKGKCTTGWKAANAPCGAPSAFHGFSHGLKTVRRTVFLTAFRIPLSTDFQKTKNQG